MTHRTDEAAERTPRQTAVRILPWTTEDAKPCLLLTDAGSGRLSRLADDVESLHLAVAADLLSHAQELLDDPSTPEAELRCATALLCESLRDALKVAATRTSHSPPPPTNAQLRACAHAEPRDTPC
ncbi:hypothetical protein [Streptomyces huiliensis]|uniref:hypothetical protein n=1 Tax=Streptomyces huiliensis TaxID=2876027 RepID=UPI001CBE9383|nr:hypothetical protein [Streptomyces huiliensis]MBZ4318856.1 hypothetical protein [Streptomyces huiliensis]